MVDDHGRRDGGMTDTSDSFPHSKEPRKSGNGNNPVKHQSFFVFL